VIISTALGRMPGVNMAKDGRDYAVCQRLRLSGHAKNKLSK
jgi:hypothetical protein